jgi:hypothetical protein
MASSTNISLRIQGYSLTVAVTLAFAILPNILGASNNAPAPEKPARSEQAKRAESLAKRAPRPETADRERRSDSKNRPKEDPAATRARIWLT